MDYYNINDKQEVISFKQAVLQGLGRNKGLFVPQYIPKLPPLFFDDLLDKSISEIAFEVMRPFISTEDISDQKLNNILEETFAFPIPVHQLNEQLYVLELFHGPTMAFKDVGARFMARSLSHFSKKNHKVTVLVATSGDTGSAVAQGFHNVPGVEVIILFPKGKVSPFQEYQMTTLGGNIKAVEVDGVFDDCQALVKHALQDDELKQTVNLSTANSINVARFLPQMLYYFFAVQQLWQKGQQKELVVSVPSGNFGNLTAGLYAQRMGLPIHSFIAANNANDTFFDYLQHGEYNAKSSIQTFSNAMDVGDPSNFVRIVELFKNNWANIRKSINGFVVNDETTLQVIKQAKKDFHYIIDPHGAVGLKALQEVIKPDQSGLVLATASPKKFEHIIQKVYPEYPSHEVDLSDSKKLTINNNYEQYRSIIINE